MACAAALLAALAVSGCATVDGLFGGKRNESRPVVAALALTENPRPPAKAVIPGAVPPLSADRGSKPQESAPRPAVEAAPASPPVQKTLQPPERPALPGTGRIATGAPALPADRVFRDTVLAEDTTWRGEIIVEGALTVLPQTTLTVEPGTVVRFRRTVAGAGAGPLLLVQGRLVARGSAGEPVRFTSAFPDPLAGDWEGIVFLASEKKNSLEHCRIEGAVAGIDAAFSTLTLKQVSLTGCGTGARLQDSVATVAGGGASGCDVGMELDETEADVREALFRENRLGMVVRSSSLNLEGAVFDANARVGLAVAGSRTRLHGNLFEKNGIGLALDGCDGTVSGGRVADNREFGIVLTRSRVKVTANEIVGNGAVGLRVDDGKGIAWGNAFAGNARYDLYNTGADDFRAIANWWGDLTAVSVETRIFDALDDPGRGRVLVAPVLRAKPLLPALNSVAK